ncbi:MAG: hypothetical protein JWO43_530 [Candidatus Adlerbacteria bacterium]|nr:hypothetical protein [Candidatus Adlerbacteria bacterium]
MAAAAAAAAAAYWLYGAKDAPKHRKLARSWMLKARAEVLDAVEKVQDIDKSKYLAIVDDVVGRYSKSAGATTAEMSKLVKDLRGAWAHMQAVTKKPAKKAAKTAKKAAPKKAAKKGGKK